MKPDMIAKRTRKIHSHLGKMEYAIVPTIPKGFNASNVHLRNLGVIYLKVCRNNETSTTDRSIRNMKALNDSSPLEEIVR